jgi:ComF family protein
VRFINSLWNYRDPSAKRIVVSIKNRPSERLLRICVYELLSQIQNLPRIPTSWIIVPIPIHSSRFRERGFNQATIIAHIFSQLIREKILRERDDISTAAVSSLFPVIDHCLSKYQRTKKQGTTSSREERLENIQGSFSVRNEHLILGKRIILIDDVTTTGATLHAARSLLLSAGAIQVLAITLAN